MAKPHQSGPLREQLGFTLMEVLVTMIMVAILAAVAIPLYSSYVTAQRKSAVDNLAQAAALAATSYYRRHNDLPDSAKLGLFLPVPGKYLISVADPNVTVRDASNPSVIFSTVRFK